MSPKFKIGDHVEIIVSFNNNMGHRFYVTEVARPLLIYGSLGTPLCYVSDLISNRPDLSYFSYVAENNLKLVDYDGDEGAGISFECLMEDLVGEEVV